MATAAFNRNLCSGIDGKLGEPHCLNTIKASQARTGSEEDYSAVGNIGDRRGIEECSHEAWVLLEMGKLFFDALPEFLDPLQGRRATPVRVT